MVQLKHARPHRLPAYVAAAHRTRSSKGKSGVVAALLACPTATFQQCAGGTGQPCSGMMLAASCMAASSCCMLMPARVAWPAYQEVRGTVLQGYGAGKQHAVALNLAGHILHAVHALLMEKPPFSASLAGWPPLLPTALTLFVPVKCFPPDEKQAVLMQERDLQALPEHGKLYKRGRRVLLLCACCLLWRPIRLLLLLVLLVVHPCDSCKHRCHPLYHILQESAQGPDRTGCLCATHTPARPLQRTRRSSRRQQESQGTAAAAGSGCRRS